MESLEPRRCFGTGDALMTEYHDHEWGRPVVEEPGMFERLALEGMQAGLSWSLVLNRRAAFRQVFHGFDPHRVASMTDEDMEMLLSDARLIRNRAKLFSIRDNARTLATLLNDGESLVRLVWSFRPGMSTPVSEWSELPAVTDASTALSKELRRLGFKFVGPTTAYATMQAAGVVNDHFLDCHVRAEVEAAQQTAAGTFGSETTVRAKINSG